MYSTYHSPLYVSTFPFTSFRPLPFGLKFKGFQVFQSADLCTQSGHLKNAKMHAGFDARTMPSAAWVQQLLSFHMRPGHFEPAMSSQPGPLPYARRRQLLKGLKPQELEWGSSKIDAAVGNPALRRLMAYNLQMPYAHQAVPNPCHTAMGPGGTIIIHLGCPF